MNEHPVSDASRAPAPPAAAEAVLRAEGVSKTYPLGAAVVPVLRAVDVEVRAGETVAIVGASGAGKSTLLHILGGIEPPSGGRVLFRGDDVYRWAPRRRTQWRAWRIGFVFQFYHLLPELDVRENVLLPAMIAGAGERVGRAPGAGASGRAPEERAQDLLRAVGLAERAGHLPSELSGGEQQRAAVARALINEPDLILADEPTGNLDSATGEQVLRILFALARERGHALALVTHNLAVARRCDRLLELKDGCLA